MQRTCLQLSDLQFSEIKTIECLLRPLEVRTCTVSKPPLGPLEDVPCTTDKPGNHTTPGILTGEDDTCVFKSAVPPAIMPGHTGFLTFATLCAKILEHGDQQ